MIKIRRTRRLVAVGAGAEPAIDSPPAVRDRPDPPRDDLVARVEEVIEVPYLKPIARPRRRDRIDCRIVWPGKLEAPIIDRPARPREVALEEATADLVPRPPPPSPSAAPDASVAEALLRAKPFLSTMVGAAAVACGYVLGRVAAGGPGVFAASFAVGLALLVAFVTPSVALWAGSRGGSSARGAAVVACGLALTAVVTAGAGAWRPG